MGLLVIEMLANWSKRLSSYGFRLSNHTISLLSLSERTRKGHFFNRLSYRRLVKDSIVPSSD